MSAVTVTPQGILGNESDKWKKNNWGSLTFAGEREMWVQAKEMKAKEEQSILWHL